MNREVRQSLVVIAALFLSSTCVQAQPATDYETLVQNGNAALQAGNNDGALAAATSAIHANGSRWEGYAVEGGALMNLRRYEEAADALSKAIDRAPEAKQDGLRRLRRSCLTAEAPGQEKPRGADASKAVTETEVVLWKSIEQSANPADFQSYLDTYPHGAFVALAERHLSEQHKRLEQESRERAEREKAAAWIDGSTGLTWTRGDNGAEVPSFKQASTYCASLRLLGYSNWRVPTYGELMGVSTNQSWSHKMNDNFQLTETTDTIWSSTPATRKTLERDHVEIIATKGHLFLGNPHVLCVRDPNGGTSATSQAEPQGAVSKIPSG